MRTQSRLPHLQPFLRQPLLFLTVATHARRPVLACAVSHEILRSVWFRSRATYGWAVGRYLLMPDHVHLFARAQIDAVPLARWMQSWKSLSSRRLADEHRLSSPIWQKDYFDRFVRSADTYSRTWEYVVLNPVRQGLVTVPADWPWQGVIEDLKF